MNIIELILFLLWIIIFILFIIEFIKNNIEYIKSNKLIKTSILYKTFNNIYAWFRYNFLTKRLINEYYNNKNNINEDINCNDNDKK